MADLLCFSLLVLKPHTDGSRLHSAQLWRHQHRATELRKDGHGHKLNRSLWAALTSERTRLEGVAP